MFSPDPRQIKTGFIRGFKSFTDLRVYSVNAMDVDLENKIKIVQKYNMRIPAIVADIYARDCQLDYAGEGCLYLCCLISLVKVLPGIRVRML